MKKKHLFRKLFRKIRIRFKYKKTGLSLEILKGIYRGALKQSIQDGVVSFYRQNPTFENFIDNYGTEKANPNFEFGMKLPTAEDTAEAESEWLESRGIHVDAKQLQALSTQDFYEAYRDLIEDWLDDEAPFDEEERKRFISTRIYGSN